METLLLIFFFLVFVPIVVCLTMIGAGVGFHLSEKIIKKIKEKYESS